MTFQVKALIGKEVIGRWRELRNFCTLTSAIKLTESRTLIFAGYVAHMQLKGREREVCKHVRRKTCMTDADWEIEVHSGC